MLMYDLIEIIKAKWLNEMPLPGYARACLLCLSLPGCYRRIQEAADLSLHSGDVSFVTQINRIRIFYQDTGERLGKSE